MPIKVHIPTPLHKLTHGEGTIQINSVTVRAIFPNAHGELLPGMFVRARLEEGSTPDAILVPQSAVTHNTKGEPTAMVVGATEYSSAGYLVAAPPPAYVEMVCARAPLARAATPTIHRTLVARKLMVLLQVRACARAQRVGQSAGPERR